MFIVEKNQALAVMSGKRLAVNLIQNRAVKTGGRGRCRRRGGRRVSQPLRDGRQHR